MHSISELPQHWQEWYQVWDAAVSESAEKLRLKGELLGKLESQQSYSAAFELFLFVTFTNLGINVDFQPSINGSNPDFRIADRRRQNVYVEAGVFFNDPAEIEMDYMSKGMPIWQQFAQLESEDFMVQMAHCSGNPGNVSPRSVRRRVQQWMDHLSVSEEMILPGYGFPADETIQFGNWRLYISVVLKTPEDKVRLGSAAVGLSGFSGGWNDSPIERLRPKVAQKASQARKTGSHCIVAIGERSGNPSTGDIQGVLFGGSSEYDFDYGKEVIDDHPYLEGLRIPKCGTDGLWNLDNKNEPIAVIVHRGDLRSSDVGELELWLNPNGSYFRVPWPLFALKVYSLLHEMWTRPAIEM